MRKGFDGLYGLVRDRLSCEPLSGHLFLFCNAQRNRRGGRYCEDCHVADLMPDNVPVGAVSEGVRGYAVDAKTAEALWRKSEELVEEFF